MPFSARFETLKEQLDGLKRDLLPVEFDPTGTYDDQSGVNTRALAYRVLAHAEIESFLEDRAIHVVTKARKAWDEVQHVSRIAFCLMAFSGKEMSAPPDTLIAPSANKTKQWPSLIDIGEKLVPVTSAFHNFVRRDNHGIKEKNFLSLFLPVGLAHSKIDPTFLAGLDSFGSLRGQAAHSTISVQQAVDPAEELKRVEALLPGLEDLDSEIDKLIGELPAIGGQA